MNSKLCIWFAKVSKWFTKPLVCVQHYEYTNLYSNYEYNYYRHTNGMTMNN